MTSLADYFNGNYIHIDNTYSKETAETLLYIKHAGFFTPAYCPKTKMHNESGYLFLAVLSGNGAVEYKGKLHTVTKGQCIYIDCSQSHYHIPDLENPWGITWINFSGPSAKNFFEFFEREKSNFFAPENFEIILMILTKIIDNNLHKSEITNLLNAKFLTDLLTSVILNNSTTYDDNSNKFKHKLFSVKDYLDSNFKSQLNLDDIAERFYISKFYLTREFKKAFGTTVIQYVLNKRIEYAKELLIYSNKSIEEISEACGFNDQSYFSRQFKKSEGMTCLSFRKKNL